MTRLAAWCLRIAGANGIVNGLGFGGFAIPAIVSVGQGHGIIYTFGNPTYGNGPFERIGVPTTVPLLAAFLAACVVQVVGGVLLLWPRPSGIVVSVVGMLLGVPFWWGFDLPFAWLNAAVVLTFLVLAWTVQKGSSRGPSGGGRSSVEELVHLRETRGDPDRRYHRHGRGAVAGPLMVARVPSFNGETPISAVSVLVIFGWIALVSRMRQRTGTFGRQVRAGPGKAVLAAARREPAG